MGGGGVGGGYFRAAAELWCEWLRKKQLKAYGICVLT